MRSIPDGNFIGEQQSIFYNGLSMTVLMNVVRNGTVVDSN